MSINLTFLSKICRVRHEVPWRHLSGVVQAPTWCHVAFFGAPGVFADSVSRAREFLVNFYRIFIYFIYYFIYYYIYYILFIIYKYIYFNIYISIYNELELQVLTEVQNCRDATSFASDSQKQTALLLVKLLNLSKAAGFFLRARPKLIFTGPVEPIFCNF